MYYTLGRVWIEAMRIDDAEQINLFGITTRLNVWTSIFVFVAALVVFILLGLKAHGRTPDTPLYLRGAWKPADAERRRRRQLGDERHQVVMRTHAVSDSDSRGNLPDNQSGSGPRFRPRGKQPGEHRPGQHVRHGCHGCRTLPAGQATGSAPEADNTK